MNEKKQLKQDLMIERRFSSCTKGHASKNFDVQTGIKNEQVGEKYSLKAF